MRALTFQAADDQGFFGYLLILRKRVFTILVVVVVAVVAVLGIDLLRTNTYVATASLQLLGQNVSQYNGVLELTSQDIVTDIELIRSPALQSLASKQLGSPVPIPAVAQVGLTTVLTIAVSSPDPHFAADAANAIANSYVTYTEDRYAGQVAEQESILEKRRQELIAQINDIETQIAANKPTNPSNTTLNTQLQNYAAQLQTVNTTLTQLQLDQTQVRSGAIVIGNATVPTSPSSPKPIVDASVAGLIGILIGIGVALGLDYFDDRVDDRDELTKITGGMHILGEIPFFEKSEVDGSAKIVAVEHPRSKAAEAYRALRTSVQFLQLDSEQALIVQFTSPLEGEGKTTTTIDLAATMAQGGVKVALVGCDLRRPQLSKFFNWENEVGLSSYLSGSANLTDIVKSPEGLPNLTVVDSGVIPPNPSELLSSPRLRRLLVELAKTHDTVIVDSPPLLPVTDALVIAQVVDAVVLIVRSEVTRGRSITRALESLGNINVPVVGLVYNAVKTNRKGYGKYGYGRGYGYRYGSYSAYVQPSGKAKEQ